MAVARPPAGAPTGLKVLAIVSIVVAVAALAGFVIFYTQLSKIEQNAEDAKRRADSANQQLSQARSDFDTLARTVSGDVAGADAPAVTEAIRTQIDQILTDERLSQLPIDQQSPLLTVLQELYGEYRQTAQELNQARQDLTALQSDVDDIKSKAQQTIDDYEEQAKKLAGHVGALKKQFDEAQANLQKRLDTLDDQLASASTEANKALNVEREKVAKLEEQLNGAQDRIKELLDQLASFKPSIDQTTVLQEPDGTIVQTIPGEDIVYISLGKQDGVRPGMTFAVYSRMYGIPENGQGKANIEVINAFGTVSECRVTSSTPEEPIMQGDLIANPVFDKTARYTFVVAGEFDLNFDGKIDDPDGSEVVRMIRQMGGKVADDVTTQTDFVVLGSAPKVPTLEEIQPSGDESEQVLQQRIAERQAARERFDRVKAEAKSLSIPVLTRTQFLHYVGKHVPEGAED